MKISNIIKSIFFVLAVLIIVFNFSQTVVKNPGNYTRTDYWKRFKSLEDLYNSSQYIQKHPKAIITDDVVYSYNAGRFIQGENPILINPEVPPLGKYIIGLSIILFNNESIINLFACILVFPLFFLLSYLLLKNALLAIIPPLLFSFQEIYKNQIIVSPILDIFQLNFLILSFIFFILALSNTKKYLWFFIASMFFLGCFVSTKFYATGFVVASAYIATILLIAREKLIRLIFSLLIVPSVLILSYSKMFMLGYNLREVIGVQKWIFHYNTGHFGHPPFTVWDLILFNRWHTWWADNAIIADTAWSLLWPISLILSILTIVFCMRTVIVKKSPMLLIMIWVVFYMAFLNVGQATSRYFFVLIPFLFILSTMGLSVLVQFVLKKQKISQKLLLVLISLSLLVCFPGSSLASNESGAKSAYVLPYPGVMPGSKIYSVSEIFDNFKLLYTFGDYARFKYYLGQSDKYLVEAKTLFEYGQFLHAQNSLEKSNINYRQIEPILNRAKTNGRNTSEKDELFRSGSQKHIEVLQTLKNEVPENFLWEDEKASPRNIKIHDLIDETLKIRMNI